MGSQKWRLLAIVVAGALMAIRRRGRGLRPLTVVALLAAGTLATFAAVPAHAEGDALGAWTLPDVAQPEISDPASEAEMEDLQTIASQTGMSLQAVIDRFAWNDNFALAVTGIRNASPNDFAGAAIVDANHAWVGFAGRTPDAARDLIDAFSNHHRAIAVELREDLGFTEVELERAIEQVHYAVLESPGVRDASTSFEFDTGEITTTVTLESSAPSSLLDDLKIVARENLVTAAGEDILTAVTTSVVRSNSEVLGGDTSAAEHLGGEALSQCTSGFGTKTAAGTRGISTAGHCGDALTDDGKTLTLFAQHEGTHGDFQWHLGAGTETDDFYSGNSTTLEVNRRDVSSVGAPTVGQSLCKNGKTTKKSCEVVRKLAVCYGGECNLIQMETRSVEDGDSGGSVFFGNTAYGLVKGFHYDPAWPFDRDLHSRADRIDNATNTFVATS